MPDLRPVTHQTKFFLRAMLALLSLLFLGLPAIAQVSLTPSTLSFGNRPLGETIGPKPATLTNTQTVPLTISSIAISGGTAPGDYAWGGTCPISPNKLGAGRSCTITVTFTPTALGSLTASLTVTDDASNSPQSVALTGTGIAPVTVSPTSLTFPSRLVGTTSPAETVTLVNHLNTQLLFSSITASGDFAVASNTCGSSIGAGLKCTIGVTFTPTAIGPQAGTLTISDSAFGSPSLVPLSGTGNDNGLTSISVTPANPSIAAGNTQQFTATGYFTSGGPQNLTPFVAWTAGQANVATITAGGLATGVTAGASSISATLGSITGSTTLTVTAGFVLTGSLNTARFGHTTTLLNNGTVLIAGGSNGGAIASAELYGPTTGAFTSTGSLNTARDSHTATLLNNGTVLITGGTDNNGNVLASAELYNPAAGTFTFTGSLNTARSEHTATLLNNGMVLIAGGQDPFGNTLANAELYNPASGVFTPTGSLNTARFYHTATLLNNGGVLIAGGQAPLRSCVTPPCNAIPLAAAELYNPATGVFTPTGSLNTARAYHTATLLNNGIALMAGGLDNNGNILASAELYNPTASTFTLTGSLNTARYSHTAALLNNGMVLIAGGTGSSPYVASAELYDPTGTTFTQTGSLNAPRHNHAATLLTNGMLLVTGGSGSSGILASAELYQPATMTPPNLVSISISPSNPTVPLDTAQLLTATGTFSDNSTEQLASVTWSSSNPAVVTITDDDSDSGSIYALAMGTATVSACAGSVCGSTTLTVAPPALVSIAVTPANGTVPAGFSIQLDAMGTYSDGSTQDLTSSVTWTSSAPNVATINSAGLASGLVVGTTTVTASSGAVQGTTTLTVSSGILVSIAVTPSNASVTVGSTQQFMATGTYSDNSTQNLTSVATWSSSALSVATITAGGLATGVTAGSSSISASEGSITGTTTLTVTAPTLVSIAVTPANSSITVGSTQQFTATGTYSDSSTQNLTSTATWSSSATGVATIAAGGLATSAALGNSNISSTVGTITGTTTLTVTNPSQLPLGTVSAPTSETCPSSAGGSPGAWVTNTSGGHDIQAHCYHATVSCPNMPDLGVTYGVATPAGTSRGTVVFVSASGGTTTLAGNYINEAPFDLFHFGYQTVQFAWDTEWQMGSSSGSLKIAACRVATFLNYAYSQYYQTNSSNSPTAGMCAQGQSGGAGGLAFSLTEYGASAFLDKAVFVSGPQYANLVQGCSVPNNPPVNICPSQNGNYPMGCNSAAGTWTDSPLYTKNAASNMSIELANDPPCNNPSHTYTAQDEINLAATSVVDGAADSNYNYPQTAITAWECDDDSIWQNSSESQGWLYFSQFSNPSQVAPNCNYSANNTPFPNACFAVHRVYGCPSTELAASGYICNGSTCPVCTGNPPTNCTCGGVACSTVTQSYAMPVFREADYEDPVNGCIKRH
jgi:trimeric autotransporter adhesin